MQEIQTQVSTMKNGLAQPSLSMWLMTTTRYQLPTFDPVDPVTVAEDAEVGKLLATVTATDQDVNDDFNQFE